MSGSGAPDVQPNPSEKSILSAFLDGLYLEAGPAVGASIRVSLIGINGAIGTPQASMTARGTAEGWEGRYTVEGGSVGFRFGSRAVGRFSPRRVTQRFDSDLGPSKSWREEVAEGGFITSSDGTVRADSYGQLAISVTVLLWRINIGWDAFRSIHEASD